MNGNRKIWANLALLLTAAIWGSGFVFQKFATDELSTSFIVAARFTVAGIVIAIAVAKKWKHMSKRCFIGGFWAGVTLAVGTAFQTVAMSLGTSPGKSAFLTACYCVMVPFMYWGVKKEKPKKNHVLSAFLCVFGIGLISLTGGGGLTLGDIATLVCGVIFAANIIVISLYSQGNDPMLFTAVQICTAAVCGWVCVLFAGGMPETVSMGAMGNILYLAVFSTCVSLTLQTFGLKYTNATVGTVLLSLESVFGVIFSILLYGEKVTARMGIGFAVVFVAVLLSQMDFSSKKEEETQKISG